MTRKLDNPILSAAINVIIVSPFYTTLSKDFLRDEHRKYAVIWLWTAFKCVIVDAFELRLDSITPNEVNHAVLIADSSSLFHYPSFMSRLL